jgi:dihydroorotate dehydrogenase electron transfer subunit
MTKPTAEDTCLIKKRSLANDYFAITLGPYSRVSQLRPGQFVHILMPGTDIMFRRAFSIASTNPEHKSFEILFKVFGRGTARLGRLHKGDKLNVLGPLGNTFTWPRRGATCVMVAGGIGFPPLLFMAEQMVGKGYDPKSIHFFYGGRTSADILERTRLRKLGIRFHPVTEDGSFGTWGMVTEPVTEFIRDHGTKRLRLYGCGPEAMLRATNELALRLGAKGQLSLEAPMPCGVGICLGCVVPLTAGGHARVCVDGPVFDIGEVAL